MVKKRMLEKELGRNYVIIVISMLFFIFAIVLFWRSFFAKIVELEGELPSEKPIMKIFRSVVHVFINLTGNRPPIIEHIDPEIYVCENSFLEYFFNVTDADGDVPSVTIIPANPFFVVYVGNINLTKNMYEIISGNLDKGHVGGINNGWKTYNETVYADDGEYADSAQTNITIIEINNAPFVENIGVRTVWTRGENNTFYKQVQVTDTEDGTQNDGKLAFNIVISNSSGQVNLFNITQRGIMNYTANESHVGVYNIEICVIDNGLLRIHPGIVGNCSQDGGNITICKNFSLTVTNENRKPVFVEYYYANLSLEVEGTSILEFNITIKDPDGTIPDTYWYVDDSLKKYEAGVNFSEITHVFGCGVSGNHTVKAEITDGLLNNSVQWNLSINYTVCPVALPGGGGGGGGAGCAEEWVCNSWRVCKNAEKSLEAGEITGENYRGIKETCLENKWDDEKCGFQTRNCFDLKNCTTTYREPDKTQTCYYTEKPSCSDKIKNCHDGECEILADCGGPCPACPTCSDNIKNQGEQEIDCGGPCPACQEKPLVKRIKLSHIFIFLIIILLLLIVIIFRLRKIIKIKKEIKRAVR